MVVAVEQPPQVSRLERRARRARLLFSTTVAAVALAASGVVAYQVRYDSDTRYIEVGLFELPWGVDGSSAIRGCLPGGAKLTLLNTTGRYQVAFVATRRDADLVVECVQSRPVVQYAARLRFSDVVR